MKSRLRTALIGTAAIGSVLCLAVDYAVPADAATMPGSSQTCASGQPKLDYEWSNLQTNPAGTWSNVCGDATWTWNQSDFVLYIRMPTSPYHRVWFHQYANGSGGAVCLYSEDNDVQPPQQYVWEIDPGNIQVSANTSPC